MTHDNDELPFLMSSPRMTRLWAAIVALGAGVSLLIVTRLRAQDHHPHSQPSPSPLDGDDVGAIERALEAQSRTQLAGRRVQRARDRSLDALGCRLLETGLDRARRAFYREQYGRTERMLTRLLEHAPPDRCPESSASPQRRNDDRDEPRRPDSPLRRTPTSHEEYLAMARLLYAHVHLERDHPERALTHLDRLEASPIEDYLFWLRARAHQRAQRPERAASWYGRIYRDTESPLRFRARARQASTLVDAEQWQSALPVIEEMLETFPDYPRRARLMYQKGRALEQLGRFREAARAYRDTWLEFPHKPSGDRALAHLDTLRLRGVRIDAPSMETLFDHYRELRRHKHWELAGTLLERLLERAEQVGDTELAHRILMQLALNAYIPKRHQEALRYFRRLRRAYRAGRREGIDIASVYEYLGRLHARLGHLEKATSLLERAFRGEDEHERKRELAEFFMGFQQYEKARKLFASYFSKWRKRRWTYTWLLYKTGRLEEAHDHMMHLAEHRNGRREARALYWAGRVREHQRKPREATEYFQRVMRESPHTYYGFQAENRLLDLEQRQSVDGSFAQRTRAVVDSSDHVLEALDHAAETLQKRSSLRAIDPTLLPKHVPDSRHTDAADRCRPGRGADAQFCHLLAGRIPRPTLHILERALSPSYSPRALLSGGFHAFHIRSSHTETDASTHSRDDASPPGPTRASASEMETPSAPSQPSSISYPTDAKIYWEGRYDSETDFARHARGEVIGPVPRRPDAYDRTDHIGGVTRAAESASELFPQLERAHWLWNGGLLKPARDAVRDVALEFKGLAKQDKPDDDDPHELPHERWTYLIDHRRGPRGYWGYRGESQPRFPVPEAREARRELADRQQTIIEHQKRLRPLLLDAMMEVGEYHLVRQWTLDESGWYHRDPSGPARDQWMRAYPRAFPRLVLEEAREHGINPYLIWSLMAVESAYNPDSISYAEAIGLLQVIPRTGIKVAEWLGDEDFSPYDLVRPEVAIQQGTSYLSSLIDKFHHQELFAVAGYNGGPHRVALWLDRRGEMPFDEFVEEIPFTQTRRYVKKVTRYLGIYLRIYEQRDSLYIGQRIDPSYRPHPNF